jgi:hypothetical protein
MKEMSRRLLALEIQRLRHMAAEGGAPYGFGADAILDELIDFLQRPREQQKRDCPGYSDAELDWLESRRSLYRMARHGPAKGR